MTEFAEFSRYILRAVRTLPYDLCLECYQSDTTLGSFLFHM